MIVGNIAQFIFRYTDDAQPADTGQTSFIFENTVQW